MSPSSSEAGEGSRVAGLLDYLTLLGCARPLDLTLSPDGDRFAFVLSYDVESADVSRQPGLWIGSLSTRRLQPVETRRACAHAAWSPCGELLAFSAAAEGQLLRPFVYDKTGAIRRVMAPPGGVEQLRWTADSSTILALMAAPGADLAGAEGATRPAAADSRDPIVHTVADGWRRIYAVGWQRTDVRTMSPEGWTIWEFDTDGRGTLAVIASNDPSENAWYGAVVGVIDTDQALDIDVAYQPDWQVQSVSLSPDGTSIAFTEGYSSDRGQACGEPVVVDRASGAARTLVEGLDLQRVRYLPDERIFYVGQSGVNTVCGLVTRTGHVTEIWNGPATLGRPLCHDAAISPDARRVVAVLEAPAMPPEVMRLDVDVLATASDVRRWEPVTDVNRSLRSRPYPAVQVERWTGKGGDSVEGILMTPTASPPHPLVVYLHGGPNNAWTMSFAPGHQALGLSLVSEGYAVLLPNPHGSTGRGQRFARAHIGDYGPTELVDVLAGIDALADEGVVDAARVAVMGGSAGGYLSAWAATACHGAFAAAIPMACVSDWTSFHFTSNIPRLTEIELDSDPHSPDGRYWRLSPVAHAHGSTTPTLILHGEDDLCTPVGQAHELFHALCSAGGVAELVVYPREGHIIRERLHLEDRWTRVVDWLGANLGTR